MEEIDLFREPPERLRVTLKNLKAQKIKCDQGVEDSDKLKNTNFRRIEEIDKSINQLQAERAECLKVNKEAHKRMKELQHLSEQLEDRIPVVQRLLEKKEAIAENNKL